MFLVDSDLPSVVILFPSFNQVFTTNSVIVSGLGIEEGSGLRGVWLRLGEVGGFGRVKGKDIWMSNLTGLSEGTNTVYVYAVDNAGNTSLMQSVSFVVSTNVVVSITNPTNNQPFNTTSVVVSGVGSSYSGVKEVWLRLGSSGSFGKVSGTTSWFTNLSGLSEGTNVVYVYGVDNAGNVSVTQVVSFVVDTSRPTVAILHPTNNHLNNSVDIVISGSSSSDDLSGVRDVWLRLGDSGGFGRVSGTSSWSSNLSELSEGTNTVYVYAVDNAGNTSSTQSVSFIVAIRVYVSTSGDDANDGITKTIPVRSIQVGLSRARSYNVNEIYITTGLYTPGSGLNSSGSDSGVVITNNNVRLIGGWNIGFSSIVGYSELDGNNVVKHIIFATNVTNLVLSNLVIRKGNANGGYPHDRGGEIYLSNVSYSLIGNVVVSNNSANLGGGIFLGSGANNNTISGSVYGNSANWFGGGYICGGLPTTR